MVNLCVVVNEDGIQHVLTCVHDIFVRKEKEPEVSLYIIGDQISEEAVEILKTLSFYCKAYMIQTSSANLNVKLPTSPEKAYVNTTSYLKLFIPELLKTTDVERVLYIDSDTLCRRDITELYNTDLHGYPVGVMKNPYNLLHEVPSDYAEYDTGVMIMDIPKLREMRFSKQCADLFSKEEGCEDRIFSLVMKDKCYLLPPTTQVPYHILTYNITNYEYMYDIQRWNKFYGTNYKSLDNLFDEAYFYHYCTYHDITRDNYPLVKKTFDISSARLNVYLLTRNLIKVTSRDDTCFESECRLKIYNYAEDLAEKTNKGVVIDWTKYFDQIYCIHYCKYEDKKQRIDDELKRVGILDSPIFQYKYTYRTPFDAFIREAIGPQNWDYTNDRCDQVTNLTLAHYAIYQEAVGLGYKHILILEDDITFTKNMKLLREFLDNMPKDYDYIHFDKVLSKDEVYRYKTMVPGEYYNGNYSGGNWGGGCQAYSDKALSRGITLIEESFDPADIIFVNRNDDRANDLNRYTPIVALVHQFEQDHLYYTPCF